MTTFQYYGRILLRCLPFPLLKVNYTKLAEEQHLLTDTYFLLGLSCWSEVEEIAGLKKAYWEMQASMIEENEWHKQKGAYLASQGLESSEEDEQANILRRELWMEQMEERWKILAEISEVEKEEKVLLEELEILALKRRVKKLEYSQEEAAIMQKYEEKKEQKRLLMEKQAMSDKSISRFKGRKGTSNFMLDIFESEQSQKDNVARGRKAEYIAEFRRIKQMQFRILTKIGTYIFQNSLIDTHCKHVLESHAEIKWVLNKLSLSVSRRLKLCSFGRA